MKPRGPKMDCAGHGARIKPVESAVADRPKQVRVPCQVCGRDVLADMRYPPGEPPYALVLSHKA